MGTPGLCTAGPRAMQSEVTLRKLDAGNGPIINGQTPETRAVGGCRNRCIGITAQFGDNDTTSDTHRQNTHFNDSLLIILLLEKKFLVTLDECRSVKRHALISPME
jgi:hypothetical protein